MKLRKCDCWVEKIGHCAFEFGRSNYFLSRLQKEPFSMIGEAFASVWDALEENPAEAAKMKVCSELLFAIQEIALSWQLDANGRARKLVVSRAILDHILAGHISEFSLDDLVKLATQAGILGKLDLVCPAA